MITKNKFNCVHVIQSLPENEIPTGRRLYDSVLNTDDFRKLGVQSFFHIVNDSLSLYACLTDVYKSTEHGSFPMLHFEMHGHSNTTGLVLCNGEFVGWNEIKIPLTRINIAVANNLMITMAVCNGAHIASVISPSDRALCWGFFGPLTPVRSLDVISYRPFYEVLLKTSNGKMAMDAFNNDLGGSAKFEFMPSEEFFKFVIRLYNETYNNPQKRRHHVEFLYHAAKAKNNKIKTSYAIIKKLLKQFDKPYFEKCKNTFFMIDLYPENRQRFTVDYTEVCR